MKEKNSIQNNTLFLFDGSYFLYRSYFALPPLYTTTGHPTQATFVFLRTLKKFIKDYDLQFLAIVWDSKGGSKQNKELHAEYKAHRPKPPNDLFVQKEDIINITNTMNICNISLDGYEADDLIGSIVKDTKQKIIIVTADKDLCQLLIHDHVTIIDPSKNNIITAKSFEQEKGFAPEKIPFYFSLLGDASDNIPGVKGIGKKIALELVQQFESLDDVYKNLNKIEKNRAKTALENNKDDAFLSLKLFTLDYIKLDCKKNYCNFDKNSWNNALKIFEELEFNFFVKEINQDQKKPSASGPDHNLSIFEEEWKAHIVTTKRQLEEIIKNFVDKKIVALDTETTGIYPMIDKLVGISLAYNNKEAFYIPVGHEDMFTKQLSLKTIRPILQKIFSSKIITKVFHFAKFDQIILEQSGFTFEGKLFDTIIAANLFRNSKQKINLKDLSQFFLSEEMITFKKVLGSYKNFGQIPVQQSFRYAAHDALQTFKLYHIFIKKLSIVNILQKYFDKIEIPLHYVLIKMEKYGVLCKKELLDIFENTLNDQLEGVRKNIEDALIKDGISDGLANINLNSPQQLEKLLFDTLNLPVIKKTKKKERSTDQEVLLKLSKQHIIPGLLLQHRELSKLLSTYVIGLRDLIHPETKRVHSSFSQTMTATGRLASSNPNMQNIPATTKYGVSIRKAFIPQKGYSFLSADYSQIELRILAHFSKDKNLIKSFKNDVDIHSQTAAELFDIPVEKVTKKQRQAGKKINFSIVYGLTPYGLSQDLEISTTEAKKYIDKYFAQYPGALKWMDKTIDEAMKNRYVESWKGKRRFVPELFDKNHTKQELGRRIAINTPIQSTAADIIKIAMIEIDKIFKKKKFSSKIILQLHDELLFETKDSEVEEISKVVYDIMTSVVDWEVRLDVNIRIGNDWEEVTK
jgi:DNA polymerase I